MAVWPFIISRYSKSALGTEVVNHEKIHFKQQLEMMYFVFFLWYFIEYLILWIRYKDKEKAYLNIRFEKEAYGHQSEENYLSHRKPYSWMKHH